MGTAIALAIGTYVSNVTENVLTISATRQNIRRVWVSLQYFHNPGPLKIIRWGHEVDILSSSRTQHSAFPGISAIVAMAGPNQMKRPTTTVPHEIKYSYVNPYQSIL